MRKRRKHPQPDSKDQRIAELEEQLAQALLIIQKQQKQIEGLQQMNNKTAGGAVRSAALGGAAEAAGAQAWPREVCASGIAAGAAGA